MKVKAVKVNRAHYFLTDPRTMHVTLRYNVISGLCNGTAFAMRERNETSFVYAHLSKRVTTIGGRNGPTDRNRQGATQLDAADWLVRLRPVGCGQLFVTLLRHLSISQMF